MCVESHLTVRLIESIWRDVACICFNVPHDSRHCSTRFCSELVQRGRTVLPMLSSAKAFAIGEEGRLLAKRRTASQGPD